MGTIRVIDQSTMSRTDAAGVSQALSDLAGRLRAISLDSENTPIECYEPGRSAGAWQKTQLEAVAAKIIQPESSG